MNTKPELPNADDAWLGSWIKHKLSHEPSPWVANYVYYILFSCNSEDGGITRPSPTAVTQWLGWLGEREVDVDVLRAKQYCINYIDC
jgi:hypothetical protein